MIRELVEKNRSYRGYDESRKMTREELAEFVDCARLTASAANKQPLRYYLAWEQEQLDKIQPLTGWAKALPEMRLPLPGKNPTGFIVICRDVNVAKTKEECMCDVGIAAQTMLLYAAEKGLGGIMIGNFSPERIKKALGLSEEFEPVLIVAFGKPDEEVRLVEAEKDASLKYYRDANNVHYVPKRKLEDVLI